MDPFLYKHTTTDSFGITTIYSSIISLILQVCNLKAEAVPCTSRDFIATEFSFFYMPQSQTYSLIGIKELILAITPLHEIFADYFLLLIFSYVRCHPWVAVYLKRGRCK